MTGSLAAPSAAPQLQSPACAIHLSARTPDTRQATFQTLLVVMAAESFDLAEVGVKNTAYKLTRPGMFVACDAAPRLSLFVSALAHAHASLTRSAKRVPLLNTFFRVQTRTTQRRALRWMQPASQIACDQGKTRAQPQLTTLMLKLFLTTEKPKKSHPNVCCRFKRGLVRGIAIHVFSTAEFLRKKTGTGGLTDVGIAAQAAEARANRTIKSKPVTAGAFKKRPNPPNSEFRRAYERGDLPLSIYQCVLSLPVDPHPSWSRSRSTCTYDRTFTELSKTAFCGKHPSLSSTIIITCHSSLKACVRMRSPIASLQRKECMSCCITVEQPRFCRSCHS